MYTRLSKIMTKEYYQQILKSAIIETKMYCDKSPEIVIYLTIYKQLLDLQQNIINQTVLTKREIEGKYTFGIIAVRNFDDDDEYAQKLMDLNGGALDYKNML